MRKVLFRSEAEINQYAQYKQDVSRLRILQSVRLIIGDVAGDTLHRELTSAEAHQKTLAYLPFTKREPRWKE